MLNNMEIHIESTEEKKNIKFKGSAADLLKKLEINPETVVVIKNNTMITNEEILDNQDEVHILSIISGG